MDITPVIDKEKKVIQSYGDNGFVITDEAYNGSLIIFPDQVIEWPISTADEITETSFEPIIAEAKDIDILLLGTGNQAVFPSKAIRELCKANKIVLDVMNTGAACRTYNVLLSEARNVAAALIAV